jgi:Calcineurin-like phosphoesterase
MAKPTPSNPDEKHSGKHKHPTPPPTPPQPPVPPLASGDPVFAQPTQSPDPTTFKDPVTDSKDKDTPGVQPVPQPATTAAEPILTLAQIYGSEGATISQNIQNAGQIVFHSVGDTGSDIGPATQSLVADKMVSDFTEDNPADVPSFFYHLGDVVYYFGESQYYYDQFFEPYRSYPAPILGIPGNHDGIVYPSDPESSLKGYLTNFCAATAASSPDSGGLARTTMIQPGVYYTFEAPFVRILGLYSNVLEDPGVISDQSGTYTTLDQRQLTFLNTALARVKSDNYTGAVVIAVHHPPYTGGSEHGGSPLMLTDIDNACTAAGVWPHAVFSGHSHNYQRYTRTVNNYQIPYLVAGCGGHSPLSSMRSTIRTPYQIDSTLTLESYDDSDFGYLRVVVSATTMTVEFHPESDGGTTKTPDDTVTIDLANRTIS